MKINHIAAAVTGSVISLSLGYADLLAPEGLTGTIKSASDTTDANHKVSLNWSANYPLVGPPPPSAPLPGTYRVKVRVIGQGVTGSNSPGTFFFVNTHATMSISDPSTFNSIFYGTNPEVNPGNVIDLTEKIGAVYTENIVQKGSVINFGGYYEIGGFKGNHYKSNDGTNNIKFLVNGETPPSNIPDCNAPSLESFLRPYLDSTGKVFIDKMDVIVFMELTHTAAQISQSGYDLQDMVLLVTYEPILQRTNVATN